VGDVMYDLDAQRVIDWQLQPWAIRLFGQAAPLVSPNS
jgi:hypothetical protein